MTFRDALKKLNIEDYSERIFNSNSHGELFHLADYVWFAEAMGDRDLSWFRGWFILLVQQAEQTWTRPASVFQHVFTILQEDLKQGSQPHECH